MTKRLLLLLCLFLLLLAACSAPVESQNSVAVSGDATLIEVYRSPT